MGSHCIYGLYIMLYSIILKQVGTTCFLYDDDDENEGAFQTWCRSVLNGIGNFDSIGSHSFHFDSDSNSFNAKTNFFFENILYTVGRKNIDVVSILI